MNQYDYLTRTFGDPVSDHIRNMVGVIDLRNPKDVNLAVLKRNDLKQQLGAQEFAIKGYIGGKL